MRSLLKTVFFLPFACCLILSKSKIEMCENMGNDPQNLVEGKSCEKKMVVLMTVKNNQGETEKLHATVSKVRDESTNEYARMYNPFMITISKSPVWLHFPFFFTGHTVNNKPYERIIPVKASWLQFDSSKSCYDQWEYDEETKPTCGFKYRTNRIKDPQTGEYVDKKEKIRGSQGFCCHCTDAEKDARLHGEPQNYKRNNKMECKSFASSPQSSAHCMEMDKMWYEVHQFRESYRDFRIHVKAYDQIQKVINNKTVLEYVNGGEIILGPSQKSGIGKYKRIVAHYVGDFAPAKTYPVLTSEYFMIPKSNSDVDPSTHPQMMNGPKRWMIVPRHFVAFDTKQCDKMGVGYQSFANQGHAGEGYGCSIEAGSCLTNQPKDRFDEDIKRLKRGKVPLYFPERYGKLVGVKANQEFEDAYQLSYELTEDHTSLVTLQISADDIILIYNRGVGKIVRTAINDFEAMSIDGKLYVDIMNTGYITAEFVVSVPSCSNGINRLEEKSKTIDAQVTETFVFEMQTTSKLAKKYQCNVQLFDVKRTLLSFRNVTFQTDAQCTCSTDCECECNSEGGVKCKKKKGKTKREDAVDVQSTKGGWGGFFDSVGNFFNGLGNLFGIFGNLPGFIRGVIKYGIIVVCGIMFLLFFFHVGLLLLKMCCNPMIKAAKRRMRKRKHGKDFNNSESEEGDDGRRHKKNKRRRKKHDRSEKHKKEEKSSEKNKKEKSSEKNKKEKSNEKHKKETSNEKNKKEKSNEKHKKETSPEDHGKKEHSKKTGHQNKHKDSSREKGNSPKEARRSPEKKSSPSKSVDDKEKRRLKHHESKK